MPAMNDSIQPPDKFAPIQREFRPRVILSRESVIEAREEITALERANGESSRTEGTQPPTDQSSEATPKAWRNYAGEDGWDS